MLTSTRTAITLWMVKIMAKATSTSLGRMRSRLETSLFVSVDELAKLLKLSPTTVVNATKPGANPRPKTIRAFHRLYYKIFPSEKHFGANIDLKLKRAQPIGKASRV